jgi:hypothetical protein
MYDASEAANNRLVTTISFRGARAAAICLWISPFILASIWNSVSEPLAAAVVLEFQDAPAVTSACSADVESGSSISGYHAGESELD